MEEQYQKKFIIEELDLEEASLDEIVQQKDAEFMGIEDLNIFYSYPYFSRDVFDFQFRLFTEDDELVLEDIKCNDTAEDEYQSIVVNSEVARVKIERGLELIKNNCDLVSGEPIRIDSDILVYDFQNLSEAEIKKVLVNNKNVVLLELYKNFY
jgi:hypothetical protein